MPEPGRSGGAFAQPILLTLDYVKLMSRKNPLRWAEIRGSERILEAKAEEAEAEPARTEKGQPCMAATGTGQYFRGVGVRACLL